MAGAAWIRPRRSPLRSTATLADAAVVSRLLPVSFVKIAGMAATLLRDVNPCIVAQPRALAGRVAHPCRTGGSLNVADFEIPDNVGYVAADEPVLDNNAAAKLATVPVRAIVNALLVAGIPARISNTAGTYLCNACLYSFLSAAESVPERVACGLIHVPYLPSQVADLHAESRSGDAGLHQRADTASMELATAVRALKLAIAAAIRNGP